MQLTVKTLKGGKFTIEVENSNTVAEVKTAIVSFCVCVNEMFLRFWYWIGYIFRGHEKPVVYYNILKIVYHSEMDRSRGYYIYRPSHKRLNRADLCSSWWDIICEES